MQDRLNARLMGVEPTGSLTAAESFARDAAHDNTFMLVSRTSRKNWSAGSGDSVYAKTGGGRVDITSGKFVFTCTEAYRIRNGKLTEPLKSRDPDRRRAERADPESRGASATTSASSTRASAFATRQASRSPAGVGQPCC